MTCGDSLTDARPVSREYAFRGAELVDEKPAEVIIILGERYGWWANHSLEDKHSMALVHGAVNNHRTQMILNSDASTTILSLDFARKLKLKLKTHAKLKFKGLGGVTTYIRAQADVKLTLGVRVVYVLTMWAENIGDGVNCLLRTTFMEAAGVRCVRERN
ncbi:hypothetical protein PC129_g19673 [Phytophthora cactorum]|uniref:Uncharacterized protein n=2 Tax=Phytophthora cactorum TaxID=29920 RepID=A0A8T1HBA5_9STRA|nr:hypothetical protein Pcac1_g2500 [Phytophthora cactorum]KAG2832154.1 hypothetical protein PC111_g6722 [Phytophthora cactorum]KAG2835082.1 hypothetical protein PC112_g5835 [Phytophthora cactorum]KAG2860408.1 hypothetical protein PC113_g8084 [Phytophthora cactorum]KAG2914448.1 hypothetical protein PC114_g8180 [Phytophthora cactorum]